MDKLESKYSERLVLYIVLIGILVGLLSGHVFDEQKQYKNELWQDIDALTIRANQTLQVERAVMESTALNLYDNSEMGYATAEVLNRLKPTIDRKVYDYSLFIEPDTIINGNSRINHFDLIKQSRKKYGDKVYIGNPYYDNERKAVNLPIAMYIQLNKTDKRALLFTEVDFSSLVRDFTRLNSRRGGQGFLVDSNGNLFNLSTSSSLNSPASRIAHLIAEQGSISQQSQYEYEGHRIMIRTLALTEIKLIYVEKVPKFIKVDNSQVTLATCVLLLLLFLIGKELMLGYTRKNIKNTVEENIKQIALDPFLNHSEWLKEEIEQYKLLNGNSYATDLINYKMRYCLSRLSGVSMDNLYFSSTDFSKWASEEVANVGETLLFEYMEDSKPFALTPGMIFAGIAVINYLLNAQSEGKIHLISDTENQMMIINYFGSDNYNSNAENIFPQHFINGLNIRTEDSRVMILGSKVIIGHQKGIEYGAEARIVVKEKSTYPDFVFVYENESEQNAILKFYLEHLNIPYRSVITLKDIPDNSVVLITETMYLNLMDANQMGFALPYHFVICGDVARMNNLELVTISRPYAVDKVSYALTRVAVKQAKTN